MNQSTQIREKTRRKVVGSALGSNGAPRDRADENPYLVQLGDGITELAAASARQIGYNLIEQAVAQGTDVALLARDLVCGAFMGAREIGADAVRVAEHAARGLLEATYAAGLNPVPVAREAVAGAVAGAREGERHAPDTAAEIASALVEVAREAEENEARRLARALGTVIEGVAVVCRTPGQSLKSRNGLRP